MSRLKLVRIAMWLAVIAAGGVWLVLNGILPGTDWPQPTSTTTRTIGGPFTLVSHRGETVSNETLAGKPYLVFFGFTNCPDVCPTTLSELSSLLSELGPVADRIIPLFITVDPERDTQEFLADYMSSFDKRIVALRGDLKQTDAAVKAFAAYYRKVPIEGGEYTMEHTAGVILMDSRGEFAGTLDKHEAREARIAKLRKLIGV